MIPEVLPIELEAELSGPRPPLVIDVREPEELKVSGLPGALNIPMAELAARLEELDRDAGLVIICRTGSRSARVTEYLLEAGFKRVRNLATGMNGWARTVDPTMAQY